MKNCLAIASLLAVIFLEGSSSAAELAAITPANWREFGVRGKEADFIYGDLVLRNDRITCVIARPIAGRNANMTVRAVGGCVIDLTTRRGQNDQLSAFYPLSARYPFTDPKLARIKGAEGWQPLKLDSRARGKTIVFECRSPAKADRGEAVQTYSLTDGDAFLVVRSVVTNKTKKELQIERLDSVRADGTFQFGSGTQHFWFADDWFQQAYGVFAPKYVVRSGPDRARPIRYQQYGKVKQLLQPGKSLTIERKLVPARNRLVLRGLLAKMSGTKVRPVTIRVADKRGTIRHAKIVLKQGKKVYAEGRTGRAGLLKCQLPLQKFTATVTSQGRPTKTLTVNVPEQNTVDVQLQQPGYVAVQVTDVEGGRIPCKVAFHGQDGVKSPDFGPPSAAIGNGNVHYSHTGRFNRVLAPGKYEVIISRGPEYDAEFRSIIVKRGQTAKVTAKLKRTVNTKGWVSADFHSHSTPSGDNTGSQLGRVVSLVCENIEFAPCTEHNRIDSYVPHLNRLGVRHHMATCSGIELTGSPGSINHQNAFPVKMRIRTQDGGGPVTAVDPTTQIRRLAYWDNKASKLVQTNHPNLIQLLSDKDLDGKKDAGFKTMLKFMDAIEVHPPAAILYPPTTDAGRQKFARNAIFHWMQILNMGYRITGVVNTDAHYNFHESGWLRNYIKSSTDDPSRISTAEMVKASEQGNLVMSNGPFMEVQLQGDAKKTAIPGNDVTIKSKKATLLVQVQCSNWLDVNRVQVFLNGRAVKSLNFTRRTTPKPFGNGVVKFEAKIPLKFKGDTHVIVCAAGEGLQLGRIMGPRWGKKMPVAVSNPIYVDVDGKGFQANGDLLDFKLPPAKSRK